MSLHRVFRCRWTGCPGQGQWQEIRDQHEAKPHVQCVCGRFFARHAIKRHLRAVERVGKPHPPEWWPLPPVHLEFGRAAV